MHPSPLSISMKLLKDFQEPYPVTRWKADLGDERNLRHSQGGKK